MCVDVTAMAVAPVGVGVPALPVLTVLLDQDDRDPVVYPDGDQRHKTGSAAATSGLHEAL